MVESLFEFAFENGLLMELRRTNSLISTFKERYGRNKTNQGKS